MPGAILASDPVPDRAVAAVLLLGLAALFLPTFWDLVFGVHASYGQGHEPMILAVSAWLLVRRRQVLRALPEPPSRVAGSAVLALGLACYLLGRTQQYLRLEMLALIVVLGGLLLFLKGWPAWRAAWFALLFLLFAVPLPYEIVLALTGPLKTGVSAVSTQLLFWLGYPVGRSGVVITIGQYQLLVTEACAGLQTMFTIEALGLLYASLMNYRSWIRNTVLAALVVPVSFGANVVRVLLLVLVTHYFGDAAGQGFVHGFAGMVLFGVALVLMVGVDRALARLLPRRLRVCG